MQLSDHLVGILWTGFRTISLFFEHILDLGCALLPFVTYLMDSLFDLLLVFPTFRSTGD